MPTYKAPVDDVQFLLNDVFHMERYGNLPGFADASPDTLAAILEEAAKLAEEVVAPLNRVGDMEGCKRNADGSVTTPTGFKEAYKQYADGGWMGVSVPQEYGGQGLPGTLDGDDQRVARRRERRVLDVSGPDPGRDRGAAASRLRRDQRSTICRT